MYRRATAQIVLCNYEEARADLQMLLQLDAKNADALRELARIHRLEEQARAKVLYIVVLYSKYTRTLNSR